MELERHARTDPIGRLHVQLVIQVRRPEYHEASRGVVGDLYREALTRGEAADRADAAEGVLIAPLRVGI